MHGQTQKQIPVAVATPLSIDEAVERLHAATQTSLRSLTRIGSQLRGKVSHERVVVRQGRHQEFGEFQGRFVTEGGATKLQGAYVSTPRAWLLLLLEVFVLLFLIFDLVGWWQRGGTPDWFVNLEMGLGIVLLVSFLGFWWQRHNFSAAAELLTKELEQILQEPF